ncbi:hypothetical protein M3Y94_00335500 [Aphelenchoides besseyi]|nr:hypothetical protein M3Y94_00335500 [Aphelenchoides besseyi]KAI6235509.1 hypothetical protein M3Y95_00059100 [Aphelenchoides besseyi]
MAELVTWFTSRLAILKLVQLLCGFITIIFLIDGKAQWKFYTVIFMTVIFLCILTFLTLIVYFMRLHTQNNLPWVQIEMAFNAIAGVLCLIFAIVLIYDFFRMFNNEFTHHQYAPPPNIGHDGWRQRIVFITVAQLLASVFYFVSLYRTKTYGLK